MTRFSITSATCDYMPFHVQAVCLVNGVTSRLPPVLAILFLSLLLVLPSTSLYAHYSRDLVDERIATYSQAYPEIEFRVLYDLPAYHALLPLSRSLGASVSNVDYEHPADLRMTLVEAQGYRIMHMLENGMGSATLFYNPDAAITYRPYTCLITWFDMSLDDPLAATRFIYNVSEETLESMPESRRIDNLDFLMFSIDHEVFHCIDSYVHGYTFPKTMDEIDACCSRARAELRADTFAALSHLSRHPDRKTFLINLGNARTLNLLDWDLEHYTGYMFDEVVALNDIPRPDIKTLVVQAMRLSEQLAPLYRSHTQFLATVWAALQTLSADRVNMPAEYAGAKGETVRLQDVKSLCNRILESHTAVHGHP